MFIDKDEFIVRCGCHDPSHPVWFSISRKMWDKDSPPDEMMIDLQVPSDIGFWQRLKSCFRYLAKGHRPFWSYGDVTLNLSSPIERNEIVGLHAYLEKVLAETEGAREG